MVFFVFSKSDCHLIIITLIHWIKIDYVLTIRNDYDWQLEIVY